MNLTILNPWWRGKEYLKEDKHIRDFEEKKYQWRPKLFEKIHLKPNNIFSLRGPRQVGKTTLVKLLIKDLLEKVNEKAVFFWNCDEVINFRELSFILREYLELCKVQNIGKKYIFLDEISQVKNWQRSIKSLTDSGELRDCCLLMTGSNTLDIKYSVERLPGRTGKEGEDFILLPMSFSEYINLIRSDLGSKIKKIDNLTIKEINLRVKTTEQYDSELKILFNQFLITGGFPLVVNEFFTAKKIPDYIYELYLKWLIGDIVKWGKSEKILMQLLRTILLKQSSPLSWDSLSKEAEIKSHKTVSVYVEDLENMFAIIVLYFLELNKKIPDYNKNKKIYILDPFIYHLLNKKFFFKENEITPKLIEATVISGISRLTYENLFPHVYYWQGKKEVDCVLKLKNEIFPLEIKYQEKISKQDYKGLYNFNKGVLVTKHYSQKHEKYPAIPAHQLLALLG